MPRWLTLVIAVLALAAVRVGAEEEEPVQRSPVAARVGEEKLTMEELDASLQLQLYDLERERYELRARQLARWIEIRQLSPGRRGELAQVLLEPPEPPRVEVELGDAPIRGAVDAPVTIVEFANFKSLYSQRMQPILMQLLEDYAGAVRLAVRDLPLPYHRHAQQAAEAAGCAEEQGAYWRYHDVLLQERSALAREDLEGYAARLDLDVAAFGDCLDSGRAAAAVLEDLRAATKMGVRVSPTYFVNGTYYKGVQSYQELAAAVDRELERLGLPPGPRTATAGASPLAPERQTDRLPPIPTEQIPDPDVVMTLPRSAVDRGLAEREKLESLLDTTARDLDGQHLLKLRTVPPGSLFDRLGLESRDVLMLVNGAWVTDASNPLWSALAGDDVTLVLMRGAFPKTYRYRIR